MPQGPKRRNPLQAILDIKRSELPLALLMFGYFFLVITTFWILKPLKKAAFLEYYKHDHFELLGSTFDGPQAELFAKVGNMVVAFVAVVFFTRLARTMRRQQLTFVFAGFCSACTVGFVAATAVGGEAFAWLFYLYGDLFNTLMVATFFAFLNDSFAPAAAKRTYGVIVLGGVAGGAFGSLIVKQLISDLSMNQWLLVCLGLTVAIAVIAGLAGREVAKNPPPDPEAQPEPAPAGNAALEGARLALRSRYLLAIVVMVGLYEIVSTILDFQFTATVVALSPKGGIGEQFSLVYLITNVFALVVQLFFTSLIMTRLGVRTALLIMPLAIVGMSAGFFILPILWVGSFLNTVDNGLNYSVNQSAREALYTPTSRDEKYKAKAFIDMFVQRFAKALAVGVALLMSSLFTGFSGVRYLSIIVVVLVVAWIAAARYAGRRFEELE